MQCKKHRQVQLCVSKEMKPICQLLLPGAQGASLELFVLPGSAAGQPLAGFAEMPAEPLALCLCNLEI